MIQIAQTSNVKDLQINWKPLKKQWQTMKYLTDDITTEVLYGGSAGSGKTRLGVSWIIMNCLKYPGSRWLIARNRKKALKDTTMRSFLDVVKEWNLLEGEHYHWPGNSDHVKFFNGSEIVLYELFYYPSDPDFDKLGSLEICGAFIDEVAEVTEKAKNIVKSRCRYKLKEFGIIPKILMTCNPCKNFAYHDFYKADQNHTIRPYRRFVQALPTDNKHLPEEYIETLRQLDTQNRERLLYGNWEYDDDPSALIGYDKISAIFTNEHIVEIKGKEIVGTKHQKKINLDRYLTADIARLGNDKTVIMEWAGMAITRVHTFSKYTTDETAKVLKQLMYEQNIPASNVIIDGDGIGGGVVDQIKGTVSFVNNSRALNGENYTNLKSQCYFKLAQMINANEIYCHIRDVDTKESIIEELEQVKRKDIDKDGKVAVLGKDQVKLILGRSPDYSDAMMLRMLPELKPKAARSSISFV